MKLKTADGTQLDLPQKVEPTADYELFSVKAENIVSTINGLDLPATRKNISELDPLVVGRGIDVELSSETGNSFFGTLEVDSQTFNRVDTELNCSIYDRIKKIFSDMDIGLGDIGNDGDTFLWDFKDTGNVPSTEVPGKWFLSAGDFQGYASEEMAQEGIPLNPAKFIADQYELLWTINLYEFFKKVFDYYNVSYGFSPTDEIADGVQMQEIYLFIPSNFFKVQDSDLINRQCIFSVTGDGVNFILGAGLTDPSEMVSLIPGKVTGMHDTEYNISLAGTLVCDSAHIYDDGVEQLPVDLIVHDDTDVRVIIEVVRNDTVLKTYDAGSIFDGTNGINGSHSFDLSAAVHVGDPLKIYATDNVDVRASFKFINYEWKWQRSTPIIYKTLNGIYSFKELYDKTIGYGSEESQAPSFDLSSSAFSVHLDPVGALKPMIRYNDDEALGTIIDTIDIDSSLERLNMRVSDVIKEIVDRFNIGFYINSSNELMITNYQNRYDVSSVINLNSASGEPFKVNFVNDGAKSFEYKNAFRKVAKYKNKVYDTGTEYNLGDVVKFDTGGGSKNISKSLKGINAVPLLYGEEQLQDTEGLMDINNSIRYWGIGNNMQLEPRDLPAMMFGFLMDAVRYDIRNPRVIKVIPENDDPYSLLSFVFNGNPDSLGEDVVKFHFPMWKTNEATPRTILLAVENTGVIDTNSNLYGNFKPVLDISEGTVIEIEVLMSKEKLGSFLDGSVAEITDLYNANSRWAVLNIEGFMFDQEKSVVKIKIKKI